MDPTIASTLKLMLHAPVCPTHLDHPALSTLCLAYESLIQLQNPT